MNFRTWAARSCFAHLPEIVFFPETDDMLRVNICMLLPYLKALIIIMKDCRVKPFFRQRPYFCQEFPRPGYGFNFVIITKRPVAQHFKKGMVVGVPADILEIVMLARCPDAFLGICCPHIRPCPFI